MNKCITGLIDWYDDSNDYIPNAMTNVKVSITNVSIFQSSPFTICKTVLGVLGVSSKCDSDFSMFNLFYFC
jgi:hypothetical protein